MQIVRRQSPSARTSIEKLRDEVEARLQASEDYRALVALNKALAEMGGRTNEPLSGASMGAAAGTAEKISQGDAAFKVLDFFEQPKPVQELMELVRADGVIIGGADPQINFSSILSKDRRFRSVRFNGRQCWWLQERPYPGEQLAVLDDPSQSAEAQT